MATKRGDAHVVNNTGAGVTVAQFAHLGCAAG